VPAPTVAVPALPAAPVPAAAAPVAAVVPAAAPAVAPPAVAPAVAPPTPAPTVPAPAVVPPTPTVLAGATPELIAPWIESFATLLPLRKLFIAASEPLRIALPAKSEPTRPPSCTPLSDHSLIRSPISSIPSI